MGSVKLIYINGEILLFNVDDWIDLRKHRILGNIIGSNKNLPSLPCKLSAEEALLAIDEKLAQLYEIGTTSSDTSNFTDEFLEAQQKEYISQRRKQLETVLDHIVSEKRNRGDVRTSEEILNEQLSKTATITKETMLWPILLQDPRQTYLKLNRETIQVLSTPLKSAVFKDLWQKGYYVTSGEKFGGDFLVYFGDPIMHHAIFIVKCVNLVETFSPTELIAFGRLGVSVRKRATLAALADGIVNYLTINWIDA